MKRTFLSAVFAILVLGSLNPVAANARNAAFGKPTIAAKRQTGALTADPALAQTLRSAIYKIRPVSDRFEADNDAQKLHVEFTRSATRVHVAGNTLEMRVLDQGPVRDFTAHGSSFERAYDGLREWYVNRPDGIEQGFVVEKKPQHFALRMDVGGRWETQIQDGRLSFAKGKSRLEYAGLHAWDAQGRRLASTLRLASHGFEIRVDDSKAVYPVTVDPVLTQGVLTDPSADFFGYAVRISADGNTAIVGAPVTTVNGNEAEGAAFVFTRSNGSWSEESELTEPGSGLQAGAVDDNFGASVAINDDGTVVLVAASGKSIGQVFVFKLIEGAWVGSQVLSEGVARQGYGASVTLSGDGKYAIVGAPGTGDGYIYGPLATSIGFIFGLQAHFASMSGLPFSNFGASGALDDDGSVALIGQTGAFSVYTRSGSSWTLQQTVGYPANAPTDPSQFGTALGLNAAGDTVVVGSYGENYDQGAAYIYVNQGNTWTEQARLTDPFPDVPVESGGQFNDEFGRAVALSSDGHNALVGEPGKPGAVANAGAVYLFSNRSGSWAVAQYIPDPTPSTSANTSGDFFGLAVSLNSDGTTALVGAYEAAATSSGKGLAYVLTGVNVTISSIPAGLQLMVSGDPSCASGTYTTPVTIEWIPSSLCTVTFASPQTGSSGTQYAFVSWEDASTNASRSITAPSANTTYTATFKTQYQLTTQASPAVGGSITPHTGFFDAGSAITVTATARPGYIFSTYSGALSGTTNPQTLILNAPGNVTAIFKSIFRVILDDVATAVASSNLPAPLKQLILAILGQLPTQADSLTAAQRSAATRNLQTLASQLRAASASGLMRSDQASQAIGAINQGIAGLQ